MNLAIIHDFLNQYGGAERVVEVLHEIYPDAPIYTSIYVPKNLPDSFKKMNIKTSFMQKLPFINKLFKYYLLLYPRAFESFDLRKYDVILSSSSAFAKGVISGNNSLHICYCYAPTRFIWNYNNYIKKENQTLLISKLLPLLIQKLKTWDLRTLKRIDYFISISESIKDKIRKYYNRESDVIYPPVDCKMFRISGEVQNYFLIVSRLNSYKNLDIAVKAFSNLGLNLKIVGTGPFGERLEKMSAPCVEFLGRVSDEDLVDLYCRCRAFIFPGEEDFGIAPLEAQASGRPVIAYAKGGALETIVQGKTGLFFTENSVESLINTINDFIGIEHSFDGEIIRENALKFDKEIFKNNISSFIKMRYEQFLKNKLGEKKI